jgi:hypothetical protein
MARGVQAASRSARLVRYPDRSSASTGTFSCKTTGPVSMPPSTKWTVQTVSLTPASTACFHAATPGN